MLMWPDAEPGSASGDWTVRLVGAAKLIEVVAASTGKPYIARITGRDTTYGWKREFLKPKWEFPSLGVNPAAIVRLVLPVSAVGKQPAALDVRWGPAVGQTLVDKKTGQMVKLCAFRGLFILDPAGFRQVEERHVAWLIDESIVVVGPPQRPPNMRARIRFDEEV